jgi:hypothetical protein
MKTGLTKCSRSYPYAKASGLTRSQTHRNSENQSTVRDASGEFLSLTPLSVHVMRIEVAALASVHDDVSFR